MLKDSYRGIEHIGALIFGLWPLIAFAAIVCVLVGLIRARRNANWKAFNLTRARWKADRDDDFGTQAGLVMRCRSGRTDEFAESVRLPTSQSKQCIMNHLSSKVENACAETLIDPPR